MQNFPAAGIPAGECDFSIIDAHCERAARRDRQESDSRRLWGIATFFCEMRSAISTFPSFSKVRCAANSSPCSPRTRTCPAPANTRTASSTSSRPFAPVRAARSSRSSRPPTWRRSSPERALAGLLSDRGRPKRWKAASTLWTNSTLVACAPSASRGTAAIPLAAG